MNGVRPKSPSAPLDMDIRNESQVKSASADGFHDSTSSRRSWLGSEKVAKVRERLYQYQSTVDETCPRPANSASDKPPASVFTDFCAVSPDGVAGRGAFMLFNDPNALTCPVDGLSFAAFSPVARDPPGAIGLHQEDVLQARLSPITTSTGGARSRSLPRQPTYMEFGSYEDSLDFQRITVAKADTFDEVGAADLEEASAILTQALVMRMDYMEQSAQPFCNTTERVLNSKQRAAGDGRGRQTSSSSSSRAPSPPPPLPIPPKFEDIEVPEVDSTVKYGVPVPQDGVVRLVNQETGEEIQNLKQPNWKTFIEDFNVLLALSVHGPVKSFAFRRLSYLGLRYEMHSLLNEGREVASAKRCPHRDFYNVRKVDTHVHAASWMNHKHLLRFMKKRAREDKDTPVCQDADGKPMTLGEVFTSLNLTPHHLSVDMLDVHADRNTFHRFDKFNLKYNPVGQSRFREIFLKTDNYIEGKFFAQLLREVIDDLEDSKYQMAEPRVSIYGRSRDEWSKLAKWAVANKLASPNIRYLIQIPRLYNVYHAKGQVKNFQEMLDNIFMPLFEATLDPHSQPELFKFLTEVAGFDSVDDESKVETGHLSLETPKPADWSSDANPPYAYYLYYMYANITALNNLRKLLGYNVFTLRPHCGEAGPVHHLAAAFLLSANISHGLLLRKVPALQYLYYLAQIGVAMSPLSNNSLFLDYHRSPLPEFRARGLQVSLSTDDPLMFHFTKEPLIEEYSIAAQVWKLSSADMAELARNSVLMSGFQHQVKQHWLGRYYDKEGVDGNDIRCTNLPDIRVAYRHETLLEELQLLCNAITDPGISPH
ncbi:AMP deaminase 2-like isoform X3 [Sycon ciliatum]|uniref:AMP deaminase 2-like isoform X3 n=1 Tax=Sycon ciliatum TaxID=27933 RepID=UPI0031F60B5C